MYKSESEEWIISDRGRDPGPCKMELGEDDRYWDETEGVCRDLDPGVSLGG